jgi:DNA-binding beta-propeller fold protein YncE
VRRRHMLVRVLALLGLASGAVVASGQVASASRPGSELWTASLDRQDGEGWISEGQVTVSPDGSTAFVAGQSENDYATVAYETSTGANIWTSRYDGPSGGVDRLNSMALSPDGTRLFVTGTSVGSSGRSDYATVAFDAATGGLLWVRRYDGPGTRRHGFDSANSIGVTPDGSTVFVTGESAGATTHTDYATIAYDSATGRRTWSQRFDGPEGDYDAAEALAVSPDGSAVFVTGYVNYFKNYGTDYATIAYDTATGAEIWSAVYDSGTDHEAGDSADAIAVSPDGTRVFVTGSTTRNYATVAYDASNGAEIWAERYDGAENGFAVAVAMAVSPDGSTVFVTGGAERWRQREFEFDPYAYVTVAYDARTGAMLWVQRFTGPVDGPSFAHSLAVSPDGTTVYVTGGTTTSTTERTGAYATIAYDAVTGALRWRRLHDNGGASSVAVTPDGSKVIVTGTQSGPGVGGERDTWYLTIAYSS